MEKDKNLYIGYRWIEDSMKRIIALPLGLKFMMPNGAKYDLSMLTGAHEVIRFGKHSRIVLDEYKQHWYHREVRMGEMEAFDTYEQLPAYVVSEDYEKKRIPTMLIFPYIRVDYARKQMEVYENCPVSCNDEECKHELLELNNRLLMITK